MFVVSSQRSLFGGYLLSESLGERLARLREERGLTQKEVAAALKLSPQQISGYERNYRIPPSDTLSEIASILKTSTDYLLGKTDDPTPPQKQHPQLDGIRISRDYPLPPKGYEDLSPEEREEVDRITREFEDFHIQRILERKRREKGAP